MSDVAADALIDKGEILVEYAKPYGLNRTPSGNLASLGIKGGARPEVLFAMRTNMADKFKLSKKKFLYTSKSRLGTHKVK